jgi:hypothetical protein
LASALDGGQLDSAAFNAAVQRVTTLRADLPWTAASRRGTPSLAWWPLVPRRLAVKVG